MGKESVGYHVLKTTLQKVSTRRKPLRFWEEMLSCEISRNNSGGTRIHLVQVWVKHKTKSGHSHLF